MSKILNGNDMDKEFVIKEIVNSAYVVHAQLGPGFLESVYVNALIIELNKRGIKAEQECRINVFYDNILVGEFRADIFVEKSVILEIKAVKNLNEVHECQLVNYLTATRIDDGLLINFGEDRINIKRKYRIFRPKSHIRRYE